MAFLISRLDLSITKEQYYLFDANVWLWVLGIEPNLTPKQAKYMQFFQNLTKTKAVILLPAMLVSEIINRLLHVRMQKYARKKGVQPVPSSYFKQVYRLTPEFKTDLQRIYDDFAIYAPACTLLSDSFGSEPFTIDKLFTTGGEMQEFNDHYFVKIAKNNEAFVVTDDGDFCIQDLHVLTLNNQMLDKAFGLNQKVQVKVTINPPAPNNP